MHSISGRGVKYWPAPFLPSAAAFSSRPSNAAALTSTLRLVHSVSSIDLISCARVAGFDSRFWLAAKMSPRMPRCLPSVRSASS